MPASDLGAPRPHVLYVAWGFPPQTGGGVYRTLATANLLVAAGFDVTVLTAVREAFPGFTGADPTLEPLIDPRIDVIRLPFSRPLFDREIRNWPLERAVDPSAWSAHYRDHERDDFPEPHFGPWYSTVVTAAEDVHRKHAVDLVIGSANPHVDLAPGHRLHELAGVPYVIDHRDAWRLDVYTGAEVGTEDPRIAALETAYVSSAHEIWFVNEPIRRWHQELYPDSADRMRVVENGYDAAFAPDPVLTAPSDADKPLTFTYIGTIGDRVPIPEAIEGWIAARESVPGLADANVDIWGPVSSSKSDKATLLTAAEAYGVHARGPVQKADVRGVYAASDVLLLILSRGRFVTSGKVYEYMASALPIVSVHEPGNGAADVLRGYPLWFQAADLTPASIADAIAQGAAAARTADDETRRRCADYAATYERSRQLGAPISELFEWVGAQGVKR
jgi:glycosyltransferase involved in cell wall biosynthesis